MNQEKQPEALRLADEQDRIGAHFDMGRPPVSDTYRRTSAELRRLHAVEQELAALRATPPAPAAGEPNQSVTVDFKQATDLLEMFGGESSSVTLSYGNGHSGNGLYASYTDIPDEGSHHLGETDSDAAPQAQDVQDAVLRDALISARQAIGSMKVEAETAAHGDEQMMLEACEQISIEGLNASLAIDAAIAASA